MHLRHTRIYIYVYVPMKTHIFGIHALSYYFEFYYYRVRLSYRVEGFEPYSSRVQTRDSYANIFYFFYRRIRRHGIANESSKKKINKKYNCKLYNHRLLVFGRQAVRLRSYIICRFRTEIFRFDQARVFFFLLRLQTSTKHFVPVGKTDNGRQST